MILRLRPRGPLDFALTARVLRRSSKNPIDFVSDDGVWSRIMEPAGRPVRVRAWQAGRELHVETPTPVVREAVARMFGLDLDLTRFWAKIDRDRELRAIGRCRGLRPQRFASLWEACVNGICCQQLSLDAGLSVLGRLALAFGPRARGCEQPGVPRRTKDLAALRRCGLSHNKARALAALADVITPVFESEIETLDDAAARERLLDLPGVGPWTADYMLLRGLGRLAVFPHGDVGAANALSRILGRRVEPADAPRVLARFAPHSGMIYFAMRAMAEYRGP